MYAGHARRWPLNVFESSGRFQNGRLYGGSLTCEGRRGPLGVWVFRLSLAEVPSGWSHVFPLVAKFLLSSSLLRVMLLFAGVVWSRPSTRSIWPLRCFVHPWPLSHFPCLCLYSCVSVVGPSALAVRQRGERSPCRHRRLSHQGGGCPAADYAGERC